MEGRDLRRSSIRGFLRLSDPHFPDGGWALFGIRAAGMRSNAQYVLHMTVRAGGHARVVEEEFFNDYKNDLERHARVKRRLCGGYTIALEHQETKKSKQSINIVDSDSLCTNHEHCQSERVCNPLSETPRQLIFGYSHYGTGFLVLAF